MTAASAPAAPRPRPAGRRAGTSIPASGRLLRLELRHNAMLWLLPLAVALFFYNGYREIMALPPMWNLRAMTLQNRLLLDLVIPATGAAAWMGSREGRRNITDLVAVTARPRWSRQLAIWAAAPVAGTSRSSSSRFWLVSPWCTSSPHDRHLGAARYGGRPRSARRASPR